MTIDNDINTVEPEVCPWSDLPRAWCACVQCAGHHPDADSLTLLGHHYQPGHTAGGVRVLLDSPSHPRREPADVSLPDDTPNRTIADRVYRWLLELPDDMALLPDVLTGVGGADGGKTPPCERSVFRVAVADLLDERRKTGYASSDAVAQVGKVAREAGRRYGVLWELSMWARMADEDMTNAGVDHTPTADHTTILTECDWLLRHHPWITTCEWADEYFDSVRSIVRDVRQAMGERRPYQPRCECGWHIQARDQGAYYQCTGCGRIVEHWAELKRIAEVQQPMTLAELSVAIDVPEKTLYRWKDAGIITPTTDAKRGMLFDVYEARHAKATLRGA